MVANQAVEANFPIKLITDARKLDPDNCFFHPDQLLIGFQNSRKMSSCLGLFQTC